LILSKFSKYLKTKNEDIINSKTTAAKVLCEWIRYVIHKNPKKHVDKIVHKELMLAENNQGNFLIVGKSESGRRLVNALYNYAESYEHYIMSKWLEDKKANDFRNDKS